jgi:2-iminobutanoate/2-iminopropanoate deaminase
MPRTSWQAHAVAFVETLLALVVESAGWESLSCVRSYPRVRVHNPVRSPVRRHPRGGVWPAVAAADAAWRRRGVAGVALPRGLAIACASVSGERDTVQAPGAPPAVGPYSHAVRASGLLFCSGQIPLDPSSGELSGATPAEQARRCLENLREVCAAANASLERAVRLTIYTTELGAFAEINEAYAAFFPSDPPARAAVGVAALPRGALVEIDAIVAL